MVNADCLPRQILSDLVLLVHPDSLLNKILNDPAVPLPSCPINGVVSLEVHCGQIGTMTTEYTEHVKSTQTYSQRLKWGFQELKG